MLAGDLGYGNVKLFGREGALVLPSHVATNGSEVVHGLAVRARSRPLEVETENGRFFVGMGAHDWGRPVENLDFDRFVGTPEMAALLYGAWSRYELGQGEETDLIVGLPLALFTGEEGEIRASVRRIKRFLRGEHRWSVIGEEGERRLTVGRVKVASQADGTLFDYLLDESGQMPAARRAEMKREIGIVNIGMNTVDLLVARGGRTVQRFTAGDTRGVRRLLQLLGEGMYSLGELDQQLRAGALNTSGALPVWSREVLGFVEDHWGRSFRRFSRVVAAGGGSILLKDALVRRFGGKLWLPEEPVIATARGLYKLALLREQRRR
jgi:hypothetical protein